MNDDQHSTLKPDVAPPTGPTKRPASRMLSFGKWLFVIMALLVPLAWCTGGFILQRPIQQAISNKINPSATPTPNPYAENLVNAGATPNPHASANTNLQQEISQAFGKGNPVVGKSAGPPIGNAAADQGLTPQQQADKEAQAARELADLGQNLQQVQKNAVQAGQFGTPEQFGQPSVAAPPTPQIQQQSGGVISYPTLATPAPTPSPARNDIYVPGVGGVTYVGAEPGQQAGTSPQQLNLMNVAEQANFLSAAPPANIYSQNIEQAPMYPVYLLPTDPIICRLDRDVQSNIPGLVSGTVVQDVKAHVAGDPDAHPIVIPAGTVLYGPYNADVQPGDNRLMARWDVMVWPDGYTLPLIDVQASDQTGANGMPADVNNHVGRIYTTALIGAIFGGISAMSGGLTGFGSSTSAGGAFAQGAGGSILNSAGNILNQQVSRPPTLWVKAGTIFTVNFAQIQPLTPYAVIDRRLREEAAERHIPGVHQ
jgi:type IV secretory pathway VirB10-like protein